MQMVPLFNCLGMLNAHNYASADIDQAFMLYIHWNYNLGESQPWTSVQFSNRHKYKSEQALSPVANRFSYLLDSDKQHKF